MEGWNDCKSDRVAAFPHSIVPSVRTRRLESVLVRKPALLRHATRCRTARRLGARRHHRRRVAGGLRAYRAARTAALGPLVLPFAVRSGVAHRLRAAPR